MIEYSDTALRGAALAYKAADRDLRRQINKRVTARRGEWAQLIAYNYRSRQDWGLMGRPSVQGGNPPKLTAYTERGALSGGLDASEYYAVEFGSAGAHGARGQLPRRQNNGRLVWAALRKFIPDLVSDWVGYVYDEYGKAVDE